MLRFLFILIVPFLAASALAAEVRLTLESAPGFALRNNPGLAAARFRIEEARGRLQQAGRLTNPEVQLERNRNVRTPEWSVGATFVQRFPLTGRLGLEKAVTRAELIAAEAEVRDVERKLAADVSSGVVRLLALSSQRALRERQLGLSREMANVTAKRLEVGEASAADIALVQLEAQQLQAELLQLEVDRATLVGQLRPLLGVSAAEPVVTGTLPGTGTLPARGVTLSLRPDYAAARSTAEAARAGVELARAQKWQDVGVGVNVMEQRSEDAPEGFQRDTFVGLQFSLPLPIWNNNAGRIQEARAAAARTAKEVDALAVTINAETVAARDSMAVLANLISSIDRELLPKAGQVEEQLRTGYSSGQTPLIEVLRARDRRLLIERQRVDALRDYHLARVRHAAATGVIAGRRGTTATYK